MSQNTYDISGLSARLSRAFPELAPVRVTGILGEGFNSTVVETDRDIVFRIARTPGTAERFIRERVILAGLRPHLPTSIPEPLWLLEASPEFPLGVSGYRRLAGQPLLPTVLRQDNVEMLAHDVAQLLAALHCIPLAFVPLLGTPHPAGALRAYQDIREATAPVLRERLDVAEFARIDAWWDELLSGEHLTNYRPAVVHNDFWYENFLVDASAEHLTGVVDWEFCEAGDPAVDFATLLHLGRDFTERVIIRYRSAGGRFEERERARARLLWELREFYGVLHSVRFDQAELDDAIRKLRAGPLFDASRTFC